MSDNTTATVSVSATVSAENTASENPSPVSPVPAGVISDDQEARTAEALRTLHSIFHALGDKGDLGAFDVGNYENLQYVCVRAIKGLAKKQKVRREAVFGAARKAVSEKVDAYRKAGLEARAQIEALKGSMSPEAYSMVAATLPKVARIPLSDLLPCFPTGTTKEQMVKELLAQKYEISDGRSKKEDKCVLINLVPTPAPVPPVVRTEAAAAE